VHIELAEATGNVTVIPLANVVRLEVDQQHRIKQAVYATPNKVEHQCRARVFILAAHAIESARLLLLSKSTDFPDGLANTSGMVGKYFMEHMGYLRRGYMDEPLFPYLNGFETIQCEQFYDDLSRSHQATLFLQGFAKWPSPPEITKKVIQSSGQWGRELETELRQALTEEFGRSLWIAAMFEPFPVEANRIELDWKVKDYFGNPCPRIVYTITDYEKQAIRRADQLMKSMFEALGARMLERERATDYDGFGAHHSGTCRMGNDPETSVVDRNLRAHNVENLYIVGSSVFPTIGALNPTLTIAAIALRLGEHLLSIR
jgi:choline dehydrogenase-like flavoprotein